MVYIWIRQTVDWTNAGLVDAQLPARLRTAVSRWNAALTVPYHQFRAELCRIARSSWDAVEGAVVVEDWEAIPADALVLPTDDDDWFAPDAARALTSARREGCRGYVWPAAFLEVPIHAAHAVELTVRRVVPSIPPRWRCSTNNYAIVKDCWTETLRRSHMRANAWFTTPGSGVVQVDRRLSVMNRSLASQTSLGLLRRPITVAALHRKLERYRRLYRQPVPRELSWATPYVAKMASLIADVQRRPR